MSFNIPETDQECSCPYSKTMLDSKSIRMEDAERYQLIAKYASDIILVIDADSLALKFVSPSAQKLLGYSPDNILGRYCWELFYLDDREDVIKLLANIKNNSYKGQYRVININGAVIWVEMNGELIYDQNRQKEIIIIIRDITERKHTEGALQRSEERHRLILDNAYDGICIVSLEPPYKGVYANPSVFKALGYTKEEFFGRGALEYAHPEDKEYLLQTMTEGLRKSQATSLQFRYQKKDGNYIWVEITGSFLPQNDGSAEIIIISRDISSRKQADETIRKSELRLRQITDNMLDSICAINEKGIFEYVSPSHKSIVGFEPEEMTGKHNQQLLHPEDRLKVKRLAQSIIDNESDGKVEYRVQHKDGHYVWLESVCRAFVDHSLGLKQLVAGTRDISARKLVEANLRQREEDLRNKVNYLNTLIHNMNELFYTLDRDFRLTFANQKVMDVTGYSWEEVIGRSIFDFIPDINKKDLIKEAHRRLDKGMTGSYESNVICKDGKEILVKVKSSPIIEDGEITGVMVLADDITAQRKMEKEMARLGQLHTVGEMAASIGHEIRNPMTTVQGFLQIMSQNEQLKEHKLYFDLMLEELDRANSIIAEFLSLAKDKMVNLQPCNLNKIVEALAPLLFADAIKGDKYISFILGNICDLWLDEKEIRQLILNLVRNGLEAMPAGGTIIIKTKQEADGVMLSVQDEGGGIAPDIIDKLGTPFISTKENGTGLGLAVCYSIANRHHARMDYESSSAGTIFKIRFPVAGNIYYQK